MKVLDPVGSAEAAGLRYASDATPGVRRRRAGKGWTYIGPDGERISETARLAWFRRLAIPPAWTDVWICPGKRGHLQATGRDARGRKVYRYHPRWREVRDAAKYGHTIDFGKALPRIRQRVEGDLARHGLPREKVLAAVVRLLEKTCIRVGNEEYARENRSFGLTTMRQRHATVGSSRITFRFRGKSGKHHEVPSYVHPSVIDAYLDGDVVREVRRAADATPATSPADLAPEEAAVLVLLRQRLRDAEKRAG